MLLSESNIYNVVTTEIKSCEVDINLKLYSCVIFFRDYLLQMFFCFVFVSDNLILEMSCAIFHFLNGFKSLLKRKTKSNYSLSF